MSVMYIEVDGSDVSRIMDKIKRALHDEDVHHVMMGCLAMCIVMQNPDISEDSLIKAVKGASEWISCFVDDADKKQSVN